MGIREVYQALDESVRRAGIVEIFASESRPPFTVCDDPREVFYGEPEGRDRQWDDYEGIPLDEELPRTE